MQSGNERPFISQENVRAALERLVYTSSEKGDHPLLFLLLIDQFLTNPNLPPLQDAREFALRHILTTLITEEFLNLRAVGEEMPNMLDTPLDEVLAAEVQTQSPELIGWGWLYYRYIRVDLDVSPESFSRVSHVDERTLRRYQQHAIKRLTDRLTYMEWQARIEQRKLRLYRELPNGVGRSIIGRGDILEHLEGLVKERFPQKFFLTAAAGVGKTFLAEAFLMRLIDNNAVDQIVWIQRPDSAEFVRQILSERLLSETREISLIEHLLLYRVVVILDEVSPLLKKSDGFASLLAELSSALVLLIGQYFSPLPDVVHLTLPELTQQDAEIFFQSLLKKSAYTDERTPEFQIAWQQVGGNPLALQLILQNWRFYEQQTVALPSIEQLFNDLYNRMDDRLKQNWFVFALFPDSPAVLDVLMSLWPGKVHGEAITTLRQWHILESNHVLQEKGLLISNAARRYIEGQYQTNNLAHKLIHDLVDELEDQIEGQLSDVYTTLEYLLLSEWFQIDTKRRDRWIEVMWREGIKRGRWVVWRMLLEDSSATSTDPPLGIAYSLCLRRLGEWTAAQNALEQIIFHTGRSGDFLEQARAMLELAILLRGRGEYEKATAYLLRSEKTAARYNDENLQHQVQFEKAQATFDTGNYRAALMLLTALPRSMRTLALLGEVYLANGEWERSRITIDRVLAEYHSTPGEKARLFTLIGRTFEKQGNIQQARAYFSSALTLLETQHEPFALARAQANMGALMIQEQSWEEAYQLLSQATAIQTKLNDRISLQVTKHNLRLVQAHFAG